MDPEDPKTCGSGSATLPGGGAGQCGQRRHGWRAGSAGRWRGTPGLHPACRNRCRGPPDPPAGRAPVAGRWRGPPGPPAGRAFAVGRWRGPPGLHPAACHGWQPGHWCCSQPMGCRPRCVEYTRRGRLPRNKYLIISVLPEKLTMVRKYSVHCIWYQNVKEIWIVEVNPEPHKLSR
jgi:hypothetical protein